MKPLVETCNAGHIRNNANTYEYLSSKNGKLYKTCKACRSIKRRLAYRHTLLIQPHNALLALSPDGKQP